MIALPDAHSQTETSGGVGDVSIAEAGNTSLCARQLLEMS